MNHQEFRLLKIPSLNFDKVQYYTIHKEDFPKSEFKDFTDRMILLSKSDKRVKRDLDEIASQLHKIGSKFGATPNKFKQERKAFALAQFYPERKNKKGIYGLRIYCLIISERIVILLNGGDKKCTDPTACENVSIHFYQANYLADIIQDYIKDQTLSIVEKDIVNFDNDPLFY